MNFCRGKLPECKHRYGRREERERRMERQKKGRKNESNGFNPESALTKGTLGEERPWRGTVLVST